MGSALFLKYIQYLFFFMYPPSPGSLGWLLESSSRNAAPRPPNRRHQLRRGVWKCGHRPCQPGRTRNVRCSPGACVVASPAPSHGPGPRTWRNGLEHTGERRRPWDQVAFRRPLLCVPFPLGLCIPVSPLGPELPRSAGALVRTNTKREW